MGYCGLDRRRAPLSGTEHRGCWVAQATHPETPVVEPAPAPNRLRLRPGDRPSVFEGFVPVELAGSPPRAFRPIDALPHADAAPPAAIIEAVEGPEAWAVRDSLFGDAEL